jgi:hypothetical protein
MMVLEPIEIVPVRSLSEQTTLVEDKEREEEEELMKKWRME